MNRGDHDDLADHGEVPGHGPTVILAHLDGDETVLPRAVEHRLRDSRPSSAWADPLKEKAAARLRLGIDRLELDEPHPPRVPDDDQDDEDESVDGEPHREPRPTVVALVACVLTLLAVECPLVALKVGGAIAWDWAWVLAPLWVPVTMATTGVAVACVGLAAIDERDAARRRNRVN